LLVERRSGLITGAAPVGPHAIPPQQTVLILSESRQRHVEDALLGPAGLGGEGEDLGGWEARFVGRLRIADCG